jgi:hypothetical protein
MADYFPLVLRAVSGLNNNTDELRRGLYDRARSALIAHLRAVDPPLNKSDITFELSALEEAIQKTEAAVAKHSPPEATHDFADHRAEDELSRPSAGNSSFNSLRSRPSEQRAFASSPLFYSQLVKFLLLPLIPTIIGAAAYWQRNTLTRLTPNLDKLGISELAVPIFAYGLVALMLAYACFRRWIWTAIGLHATRS